MWILVTLQPLQKHDLVLLWAGLWWGTATVQGARAQSKEKEVQLRNLSKPAHRQGCDMKQSMSPQGRDSLSQKVTNWDWNKFDFCEVWLWLNYCKIFFSKVVLRTICTIKMQKSTDVLVPLALKHYFHLLTTSENLLFLCHWQLSFVNWFLSPRRLACCFSSSPLQLGPNGTFVPINYWQTWELSSQCPTLHSLHPEWCLTCSCSAGTAGTVVLLPGTRLPMSRSHLEIETRM